MQFPNSTYRLQLNHSFKFSDTREIVKYLSRLGISHIYASPVFKAKKGSMHGYDIVEQNQLNPELGTEEDFNELTAEVKKHNLGWIQDIVPNHMAYDYQNKMLVDLLENGQLSRYYNFFDIEWNHPNPSLKGRLLAPFLGKFYKEVLESGELKLIYDEDGFGLCYYSTRLPLKISTYSEIISVNLAKLRNRLGRNHPDIIKIQGMLYVIRSVESSTDADEMYDQIKFVKNLLWELYDNNPEIKGYINEVLKTYNGTPAFSESFNLLDKLHAQQNFRFSYWKVANEEVNYRRFFNVNDLISLKIERMETFNRTHSFIFKLLKEEKITGLRIDHIDGLYNPQEYLLRLRERVKNSLIVVEKILDLKEELPADWPVDGTTGYDFMNYVNGIFCNTAEAKRFDSIYHRITRINEPYDDIVHSNKRVMVKRRLAGEVERLAVAIQAIASTDRLGIDLTTNGLREALEEVLIYFPVYRTYITDREISPEDRTLIEEVISRVKEKNQNISNELTYIKNLLLREYEDHFSQNQKEETLDFAMKFQQLTGPLMAKGFEDTTLYVYNRLISLNEVGSNPEKFGITRRELHKFNRDRFKNWPRSLNATATHDTKRGEDVRARINVLSEIPGEWEEKVKKWISLNKEIKTSVSKKGYPSLNDEYLLYQTLVGTFPFNNQDQESYITRIKDYLVKSVREARVHSSWVRPNAEYEEAVAVFAEKILQKDNNKFLEDFIPFQKKIAHFGIFNSLSQTLIKMTSPGIPDFYQGTELWDFSLVDPDNRRPVDYTLREKILDEISAFPEDNISSHIKSLLMKKEEGHVKLFLIYRILREINNNPDLFRKGEYIPLEIKGTKKKNIFAFARTLEDKWAVIIAPRFCTELVKEPEIPAGNKVWENTYIDLPVNTTLKNIFTNEWTGKTTKICMGNALTHFPSAMFIN